MRERMSGKKKEIVLGILMVCLIVLGCSCGMREDRREAVETRWRQGDVAYNTEDTIYYKTYYEDFVRGEIMHMNYFPDINIQKDLEDYFVSEQSYGQLDSLVEMFYDNRTIEMSEEKLKELFWKHGYDIFFHSVDLGELNVRFVEIMELNGLSLYPTRILMQTWDEDSIYLQDITGPIPRKIRNFMVIDNKDNYQLVVHSSGVSKDYVSEEEISFWEYRDTYWILTSLEMEIDTSHAHNMGDMYPDLDRDSLFEAVNYSDGIVYRSSVQGNGLHTDTYRLGKLEEVEHNKIFRLIAIHEVEGRTVEDTSCYIQYEIKQAE